MAQMEAQIALFKGSQDPDDPDLGIQDPGSEDLRSPDPGIRGLQTSGSGVLTPNTPYWRPDLTPIPTTPCHHAMVVWTPYPYTSMAILGMGWYHAVMVHATTTSPLSQYPPIKGPIWDPISDHRHVMYTFLD